MLLLLQFKIFILLGWPVFVLLALFELFRRQKFNIVDELLVRIRLTLGLRRHTLINRVHQQNRILNSRFDYRPKLLDQQTQTWTLLFGLLYFLIKQLFAILQQLHQLFVFIFQLFYFLDVAPLFVKVFVDNLLLFEKFGMNNVHIIWICVSADEEIIHTCVRTSCVCSAGSSSSIFRDVDLICSVLVFLGWSSAVAASVWRHACPVGAYLLWSIVIVTNVLRIVEVWVVWIARLLSFSRIWTLPHQTTTDAEHRAARWVPDSGWYYVLVWWNRHRRVCRLPHVVLATWWCSSVCAGAMVVNLSGCLLSKEARRFLASSCCMAWRWDNIILSFTSRPHWWNRTAFLSTIFHML